MKFLSVVIGILFITPFINIQNSKAADRYFSDDHVLHDVFGPSESDENQDLKNNQSKKSPASENCAQRLILIAAKKNVEENFGNSSSSKGYCALGVRTSLQLSLVGDVTGPLGNAIDFINTLPTHGFIDSGIRDPLMAPAGAVIVLSGPKSDEYFKTGKFAKPPGDWLGHVTIKGDDGLFYTDGRTQEPALGWAGGQNTQGIRNVVAVFVPNSILVNKFKDSCH